MQNKLLENCRECKNFSRDTRQRKMNFLVDIVAAVVVVVTLSIIDFFPIFFFLRLKVISNLKSKIEGKQNIFT